MLRLYILIVLVLSVLRAESGITQNLPTKFERDNSTSAAYDEAIEYYKELADRYEKVSIRESGITDVGRPLHEVIIDSKGQTDPSLINLRSNHNVLMINNGIHPGEPCGIDASMMLARDLVTKHSNLLEKVTVIIIPVYNIGGALNRGSYSRANQNGPQNYGFRGNRKNLDLNRDFIKCDSRNAQAFTKIYQRWIPQVFIDNHTSNGADYQYVMTMIASQPDKANENIGNYMRSILMPDLYRKMEQRNYEMTPYVYARDIPDNGIFGFLDLPRYASGYATLFNALAFVPETHMLKPFPDRVWSTYYFSLSVLEHMNKNAEDIESNYNKAVEETSKKENFELNWKLETNKWDTISFKGYKAEYKQSEVTGQKSLYYNQNKPFTKNIKFYQYYSPTSLVKKPQAYIIPQAYERVINRLKWNNIKMQRLKSDTLIEVDMYRIADYKTRDKAYESHYLHYEISVDSIRQETQYYAGDYIIQTNQPGNRYIMETLEPSAPDSYFAWNFFDGILMQKEYFSAYVFNETAKDILEQNPKLRQKFELKKQSDSDFATSHRAQLDFIYKRSPYYESTHRLYPVGKIPADK